MEQPRRGLDFPKALRVLKKREYDAVFENGRVIRDQALSVYNVRNGLGFTRLGLVVGKKVGNAAHRNRIKRLIREAFRLNQHRFPPGYDLVVVPCSSYPDNTLAEVEERLLGLVGRLPRNKGNSSRTGKSAGKGKHGRSRKGTRDQAGEGE